MNGTPQQIPPPTPPPYNPNDSQEYRYNPASSEKVNLFHHLMLIIQNQGIAASLWVAFCVFAGWGLIQVAPYVARKVDSFHESMQRLIVLVEQQQGYLIEISQASREINNNLRTLETSFDALREMAQTGHKVDKIGEIAVAKELSGRIVQILKGLKNPNILKAFYARLHDGQEDVARNRFFYFTVTEEILWSGYSVQSRSQRILLQSLGTAWGNMLSPPGYNIYRQGDPETPALINEMLIFGGGKYLTIMPIISIKNPDAPVGFLGIETATNEGLVMLKAFRQAALQIGGLL